MELIARDPQGDWLLYGVGDYQVRIERLGWFQWGWATTTPGAHSFARTKRGAVKQVALWEQMLR